VQLVEPTQRDHDLQEFDLVDSRRPQWPSFLLDSSRFRGGWDLLASHQQGRCKELCKLRQTPAPDPYRSREGTVMGRRASLPPAAGWCWAGRCLSGTNRPSEAPDRSDSRRARTCRAGRADIPAPMRIHWPAGMSHPLAGSRMPGNTCPRTSAAKARRTPPRRRPAAGRCQRRSASSPPCNRRAHRMSSGRDTSGPRVLCRCRRCRSRRPAWLP